MLIRGQDKNILTRFSSIAITLSGTNTAHGECKNIGCKVVVFCDRDELIVGRYSTESKAIKVLDMIQDAYLGYELGKTTLSGTATDRVTTAESQKYGDILDSFCNCAVFQMPPDEEVGA